MLFERVHLRRQATQQRDRPVDWAAWLAQTQWGRTVLLKKDGHSWVRAAAAPPGADCTDVIVKCRVDRGFRATIKRLFRSTRGDRQWRGALWFTRHGLLTARSLALLDATLDGARCELLTLERLAGQSVLEHLASNDLTVCEQHHVARELGRLIALIAHHGRYNRDGKPSNLIVVRDHDTLLRVATIDTVAIRPDPQAGRAIRAMLASLYIEPAGCGIPPRRTLCARVVREVARAGEGDARPPHLIDADLKRDRRRTWHEVMRRIEEHGDPTPQVDPLGRIRDENSLTRPITHRLF